MAHLTIYANNLLKHGVRYVLLIARSSLS